MTEPGDHRDASSEAEPSSETTPEAPEHVGDAVDRDMDAAIMAARSQVDVILRARQITTVIYVDDGNPAAGQRDSDPERVIAALGAGLLTVDALAASDTTAHLVRDEFDELTTADALADRLRLHPETLTDQDVAALTDALRLHKIAADGAESDTPGTGPDPATSAERGAVPDPDPTATDLAALDELRRLIPDADTSYQPITMATWQERKDTVLASEEPVLVLFDRDFRREGQGEDAGEELLIEAIRAANDNLYCGMLTHRATSDQAEAELVAKIAEWGGRDVVEIVVIAKQTVIDEPEKFPAKLKGALLARPLHRLRDKLIAEYLDAATKAAETVKSLDAYSLSELVAAADHEGSHGAHNIVRVAATGLRNAVQRMLWTDPTVGELLGEIREVHRAGKPRNPLAPTDITKLRRDDRYLGANFLAELHLPLEPGDIFEKVDTGVLLRGATERAPGKRYILLMQACDIAVRHTGRRLGNPLTLTLARLKKVQKTKVRSFDHRLEWYDDVKEGEVWCVQVWERVQVPVRALEACVFADDGSAITAKGQKEPVGLTPGWAKRFSDMQAWTAQQLDKYQELVGAESTRELEKIVTQHLCGTTDQVVDINAEIDPTGGRIAFGLRRIGRASNDDARLMLANAGNYTARPDRDGNLFPDEDENGQA